MSSKTERALHLLRYLPRITHENITQSPYKKKHKNIKVGKWQPHGPRNRDLPAIWEWRQRYFPVGYEYKKTPWFKKQPREFYYKDIFHRRQYPPLSLYFLQLSIDMKVLDENQPIDLTNLVNTNHVHIDPSESHFGVNLTDNGADIFKAKVNIEVQHAEENVIAAIERNGGTVTTAYYDIQSVIALVRPRKWFESGEPIPKRLLPPPDCIEYYSDPKNRGYLADPEKIAEERFNLAQKYGYELPDIKADPQYEILTMRKDPRQIFYGLEPGWLINLKDREILKPVNEDLERFYKD